MTKKENYYKAKQASQNRTLKEFEGWSETRLKKYILELRKRVEETEERLRVMESLPRSASDPGLPGFKKTWTIATKIHYILHKEQRPLTSEEILNYLSKADPRFKNYSNPKLLVANYLTRLVKIKRFRKLRQPGIKTNHYFLPEWLDAEGQPKKGYGVQTQIFL